MCVLCVCVHSQLKIFWSASGFVLCLTARLEGCCLPGWRAIWFVLGLKGWLCAGLENCLIVAGAWRLSRSWVATAWELVGLGWVQVVGTLDLYAKNPERQWHGALRKLCGAIYEERRCCLRRKKTEWGPLNTLSSHSHPFPCTSLYTYLATFRHIV